MKPGDQVKVTDAKAFGFGKTGRVVEVNEKATSGAIAVKFGDGLYPVHYDAKQLQKA